MRFTVCDVSEVRGSVSYMRNRLAFDPPWDKNGPCIEHAHIGGRMWLEKKGGFLIISANVAPRHRQIGMIQQVGDPLKQGFPWLVGPQLTGSKGQDPYDHMRPRKHSFDIFLLKERLVISSPSAGIGDEASEGGGEDKVDNLAAEY